MRVGSGIGVFVVCFFVVVCVFVCLCFLCFYVCVFACFRVIFFEDLSFFCVCFMYSISSLGKKEK